jgi:oxalate decarboxylase/phosphoglucose isomerase-like protein (cupin superfamily)
MALQCATATCATILLRFRNAHGLVVGDKRSHTYRNDRDDDGTFRYKGVHNGKGAIDIKFFFREDRASTPALLIIYDIPSGASEGVHTHNVGEKEGSFDEFYYIISGSGEMQIAGQSVPVRSGDHIFTPNGVPHGIENTSRHKNLRAYLVAVARE